MEETPLELSLASIVESLIFVSDGPVSLEELARVLERDPAAVEKAVAELAAAFDGRGIRLQRTRDRLQLVSAPEAAAYVQKLLGLELSARLSLASLETLAIVAYRQPVTRPQIETIRGVNSDGVIHNLLGRGLIEELGRLETVGHPIQYGTTFDFLQYFGLESIEDLPPLPPDVNLQNDSRDVAELLRGREATARPPESAANWSEELEKEVASDALGVAATDLPPVETSDEEGLAVS